MTERKAGDVWQRWIRDIHISRVRAMALSLYSTEYSDSTSCWEAKLAGVSQDPQRAPGNAAKTESWNVGYGKSIAPALAIQSTAITAAASLRQSKRCVRSSRMGLGLHSAPPAFKACAVAFQFHGKSLGDRHVNRGQMRTGSHRDRRLPHKQGLRHRARRGAST
jgi:hypothetical protein